jgi:hypothetical protein
MKLPIELLKEEAKQERKTGNHVPFVYHLENNL